MKTRAITLITWLLSAGGAAGVAAQQPPSAPEQSAEAPQPTAAEASEAAAPAQAASATPKAVAAMPASQAAPLQPTAAEPAAAEQPVVEAPAEQVAQEQPVAQGPRMVRNLVVPQFDAPVKSRARAAVLRTLADHTEVEVVAIDDVAFAARRLQANPDTTDGRAKLSRELGIDAWLDGKITETSAHLTLTTGDGTILQEVEVEADEQRALDARTGEQMWAALGPSLSPQEAYRRAVLAEYERARRKLEARQAESQRQVELAHKARAHRAFVLRGQFSLAQRKQAALKSELDRQTGLGKAELAREAEEARQAELARQAEAARKVELARQAEAARKAEIARRREDAKAAAAAKAAAKAEAKAAAAQAKADAKAAAAQAKADAKAAKAKAKSERAERASSKRKRKHGNSTSLTNTGAQHAQARAAAKKNARGKPSAERKGSSAANSGKDAALSSR